MTQLPLARTVAYNDLWTIFEVLADSVLSNKQSLIPELGHRRWRPTVNETVPVAVWRQFGEASVTAVEKYWSNIVIGIQRQVSCASGENQGEFGNQPPVK